MWCIQPKWGTALVCAIEQGHEVYILPYDSVCMDKISKQCVNENCPKLPMSSVHPARCGAECERNGVAHLLLFYVSLRNWRSTEVKQDHTASIWAEGIRRLVEEDFPAAQHITLVIDNLNCHYGASLCKTFVPECARRLVDKLESVYTPKYGCWLGMAEYEFCVLSCQCLNRRIPDFDTVKEDIIT